MMDHIDEGKTKELEKLVLFYKEHKDSDTLLSIFRMLRPLTNCYIKALSTNKILYHSGSMARFYATLLGPEVLTQEKNQAGEIKKRLELFILPYGNDVEDIKSDLKLIVINMIERYNERGKTFLAYVNNSFHFEVARTLQRKARTLSIWHYNVTEFGEGWANPIGANSCYDPRESSLDMTIEENHEDIFGYLANDWIVNLEKEDIFAGLNSLEREAIYLYYQENLNDRQISERFCCHTNTANMIRRTAVKKISKIYFKGKEYYFRQRNSGKKARIVS